MKILLSPTKKQKISSPYNLVTYPHFIKESKSLMDILRNLNEDELQQLLGVSKKITTENMFRNEVWRTKPALNCGTSAIFTYIGEAFNYLNPKFMSCEDLKYANKNLRIFSGLYGLLKPLDIIMPYRLDIKDSIKLKTDKSLYHFWSLRLTEYLKQEIEEDCSKLLLNLSSLEYSKAIDFKNIPIKVITPIFKTEVNSKLKTVAIWSKRMRGLMAREVITNRINTEEGLQKITLENYELADISNGSYLYIKREENIYENLEI